MARWMKCCRRQTQESGSSAMSSADLLRHLRAPLLQRVQQQHSSLWQLPQDYCSRALPGQHSRGQHAYCITRHHQMSLSWTEQRCCVGIRHLLKRCTLGRLATGWFHDTRTEWHHNRNSRTHQTLKKGLMAAQRFQNLKFWFFSFAMTVGDCKCDKDIVVCIH